MCVKFPSRNLNTDSYSLHFTNTYTCEVITAQRVRGVFFFFFFLKKNRFCYGWFSYGKTWLLGYLKKSKGKKILWSIFFFFWERMEYLSLPWILVIMVELIYSAYCWHMLKILTCINDFLPHGVICHIIPNKWKKLQVKTDRGSEEVVIYRWLLEFHIIEAFEESGLMERHMIEFEIE